MFLKRVAVTRPTLRPDRISAKRTAVLALLMLFLDLTFTGAAFFVRVVVLAIPCGCVFQS
jgi:hypothetical protein